MCPTVALIMIPLWLCCPVFFRTIPSMIRELLREEKWQGTILPRIPVPKHRKMLKELDRMDGLDRTREVDSGSLRKEYV